MTQPVTLIRVFAAGPSDVRAEREALKSVIDQMNHTTALERDCQFLLLQWEDDVRPGFDEDAQAVVNAQVDFSSIDLFIGMLWKRFGTPTKRASSGSEEEFEKCYGLWSQHKRPQLMLYFNNSPMPPDETDPEEYGKVRSFKKRISERGGLASNYIGAPEFKEKVRRHLDQYLASMEATSRPPSGRLSFPSPNMPLPSRAQPISDTFRMLQTVHEHRFLVRAITFSHDDLVMVSGDREGAIRTWSVMWEGEDASLIARSSQSGHRGAVEKLVFSSDGVALISFSDDARGKMWRVGSDFSLTELAEVGGVRPTFWAFEPKGRLIVTERDGDFELRNPVAWSLEKKWPSQSSAIREWSFSPNGNLFVSAHQKGELMLWDMKTQRLRFQLVAEGPLVNSLCFSPDSRLVATCGRENSIRIWDCVKGQLLAELQTAAEDSASVAFSHDGRLLATGAWDGRINLWLRGTAETT